MHHFFRERGDKLHSESGRIELLKELVAIEKELETARDWTGGLTVALREIFAGDKKPPVDPKDIVFSAEIDLPE